MRTHIPQSPTAPGSPSKPGMSNQAKTLELLHAQPDEKEQNDRLAVLGYDHKTQSLNKGKKKKATDFHERIALRFNNLATEAIDCDEKVLKMLMPEEHLEYLFARGLESETVLHVLLNQDTYKEGGQGLRFCRLKPLLRFLLKVCPELPAIPNSQWVTPLYALIEWTMKDQATANEELVSGKGTDTKAESARPHLTRADVEEIIRYICGDEAKGGLGSAKAIESLAMTTSSSKDPSLKTHALHKAIEHSIEVDEDIIKKLGNTGSTPTDDKGTRSESCLEALDETGKTCLHLALTRPFTAVKAKWTNVLVRIKPDLLKGKMTSRSKELNNLTPLQFFIEERKAKEQQMNADLKSSSKQKQGSQKRDREKVDLEKDLENWLKLYCLKEFDNATARSIMYKPDQSQFMFHLIKFTIIAEQQ